MPVSFSSMERRLARGAPDEPFALLCRPSPIDPNSLTANLIGGRTAEEDHQIADLGGSHELPGRLLLGKQLEPGLIETLPLSLGPGPDLGFDQGGQDPAWSNRVDGDAGLCSLEGGNLGEAHHAMLRGNVCC